MAIVAIPVAPPLNTLHAYWRQSWTAIAIYRPASLPSLRHHGQERRLVTQVFDQSLLPVAGPRVKCLPNGLMCADNGWENGTVDISCISLAEILSSCCRESDIHARLSCLSCRQTSFQPMPAMGGGTMQLMSPNPNFGGRVPLSLMDRRFMVRMLVCIGLLWLYAIVCCVLRVMRT